jgi:hypothetical protein
MRSSVGFRVLRGLVYRTGWVLLYVSHLVLAFVALAMFVGAAIQVIDPNGGVSRRAGHPVTVMQRCVMGLLYVSVGVVSVIGSARLRRYHQDVNLYYPEMQISFYRNPEEGDRSTSSDGGLYDRDIDGVS